MKFKPLSLMLALFLTQSAFAATQINQPEACPGINMLQSVGVNMAALNSEGGWTSVHLKNNYNTPETWSFIVVGIDAKNETEALTKANTSLTWLDYLGGPGEGGIFGDGKWSCIYKADGKQLGYFAVAVTPALDSIPPTISIQKSVSRG
jgi:hypothetical protein